MIVIHAAFPIDPTAFGDAIELADELVTRSNREDGTIEYRAATDIEDGSILRFFERYEDEAAFEAHTRTDHFQRFE